MENNIIVCVHYLDGTTEEFSDSSIKFATLRANLILQGIKVSSVEIKKLTN